MFNFRNKKCQEAFKNATENNSELMNSFNSILPFEKQTKNWQKLFNSILFKCFKKIRIVGKKNIEENKLKIFDLMKERTQKNKELGEMEINDEVKEKIKFRIEGIEEEIEREVSEENIKHLMTSLREIGEKESSLKGEARTKMWKTLNKNYPKQSNAVPVGKKDSSGNIITNHSGLKELYLDTYLNRLRNRPIMPGFEKLQNMKNSLFNLRLQVSKKSKSIPWTLKNLENAISGLKNEKARDPNGLINEIFKEGVAGTDFKHSLLSFFNKMKEQNLIPDFVRAADVATIYKGKGEKCNLENDRGIFIVSIYRSILMRLVYLDCYNTLDSTISDSQVGGRKGKSVRNHIWIVNGIICDVLSNKKKTPVDLQIFDYRQCFDSLWIEDCMNDLFKGGLNDDKFALLYNINKLVKVAIKTPVGKTRRGIISNSIIQGDVFGPMFCSKTLDGIGKECLENGKYTYKYKDIVEIPPLIMLDDLITISECGHKTTMVNSYVKFKTSSKKLQFGNQKCKKIHVGKTREEHNCQDLYLEKWSEKIVQKSNNMEMRIEDICGEEEVMEEVSNEKYLGHVISSDGRNISNIKSRVNKGIGVMKKIITMLNAIPFGKFYFEAAVILRDSLLASSVLCNSETWYNITLKELELLESVDLMLLKGVLKAPKSTPKEMLYLELGITPFKEIIRKKRLLFLHYILNQDKKSIIYKVFKAQLKNKTSKDWVTTVKKDFKELNWITSFKEVKKMKKNEFANTVKRKIDQKTLNDLIKRKENHSKVKVLKHPVLKMQNYLTANNQKLRIEDCQNIFKMRCKVTKTKVNMKQMYNSLECRACRIERESDCHVLKCSKILKMNKEQAGDELGQAQLKVGLDLTSTSLH